MNSKLLFALLMGVNAGISVMNIPPVVDKLMTIYGVSYTHISILISVLFWSHACLQLPGGVVTDRIGLKHAVFANLFCMFLGNILPATYPSIEMAVLGRIFIGMGTGLSFVSTMKLIAIYSPEGKAGVYQAFFGGFFSLGSIIPFLALPHLILFGWRMIFILPTCTSLTLLLVLTGIRIKPPAIYSGKPMSLGRILRIKEGWMIGFYHALSFGSLMALGNWLPSMMAEALKGSDSMKLAWGGALVMLISGLARISGGFVLLRFRPLRVANGSILSLFIIFLGLFLVSDPWILMVLALLGAWFSSVNFGALFHLASQMTPPASLASLMGFINMLCLVGTVLFTFMFGLFKDAFGTFTWAFAVLSFLCILSYLYNRAPLRAKFRS